MLNLDLYPLDQSDSPAYATLVSDCRNELTQSGMFNLPGFWQDKALSETLEHLVPLFDTASFTHARHHNIYFKPEIEGLPADHPALRQMQTINHTLCADQLADTALSALYCWPPFAGFLAEVMGLPHLYPMADPLAGVNAMAYHAGEALNWHFDRSEFTTTLLLQPPEHGGTFEYAKDLRSDSDPNYDKVADLITGRLKPAQTRAVAGTLNVFRGRNTAHRVTPVQGGTPRVIAVFSYFDRPGVEFSDSERVGFYGRSS